MNRRRVVITGLGAVSPLGNSPDAMFESLREGKCSIRRMIEWSGGRWPVDRYFGSPVSLPEDFAGRIPRKFRRSMSPVSLFAAWAAKQASEDACLGPEELASPRCGCVIGSTMGGSSAISEAYRIFMFGKGIEEISSMQFFKCVSHTAAFNVSHFLGITGTVMAPCAACASGVQSVGQGRDLIASGAQDIVVCGGAEELTPEACVSFAAVFAGADPEQCDPLTCSRPFDEKRCGLVCGEGAGVLVLEEYEHALARHAKIYGEVKGYAACSCPEQISQSDSPSIVRCVRTALADAEMDPEGIGYVNAHATSTLQGDAAEAAAIRELFGDRVPVSSLKGNMGHTLGASGALELIASLVMMQRSEILPTHNLKTPSGDCGGIDLPTAIRKCSFNAFLKNSFAFGGINAALICTKI